MGQLIQAEPAPIREDASGALRVGDTNVLLELVVHSFEDGETPEVIVQQYPTLGLSDVYAVIAYYLRHTTEVEEYLNEREAKAKEVHNRIVGGQRDLTGIRRRLLSRRAVSEGHDAQTGD